ncbi:uncharacterized protein LOC114329730 [Diabrotica virgifera virgifera]|uniref:Uncharacterized protein LOC114329730 n=1 Tax=Diabrotica virgifera virgifera TaxID=50390 RepID=A0A6P7FFW3_DIAVI|nr:uncharacterized protein LOC114329730 [Diabrotica virgifera virgifera]
MDPEPNGSEGRNITVTSTAQPVPTLHPYYQTYDVMTGVRIAATLGSFFGLMAILMFYKSKSKTEKAMEDPDFTAAAIAEVLKNEEEEERQLQMALEATVHHQLNPRRIRRSLDTASMPSNWDRYTPRFSSFAGGSGMMNPPTRQNCKLPMFTDDDPEEIGSLYDEIYYNDHLDIPRRPSNITCSSSGSSYLERRDSSTTLGLPPMPAHKCKSSQCQFSDVPELYDFYYPIDIRVTHPTPGGSPCGSNRGLYDRVVDIPNLKPKLAPLASISSCNSSLGTDIPDFEVQSFSSDSVFQDDDEDTDHEMDEFSTNSEANSDDSDVDSENGACYRGRSIRLTVPVDIEPIPSSKSSSTLVGHDKSSSEHSSVINLDEKKSWVQETLF